MPKITCNDGSQLFFNIKGEGEPLVLIAGGFCDHHVWDDLIVMSRFFGNRTQFPHINP